MSTINSVSNKPVPWNIISGGSPYSMSVNQSYMLVSDSTSPFSFLLPSTAAVGDTIRVVVRSDKYAVEARITQNASQYIWANQDDITTVGTGGYLESNNSYFANIELICVIENVGWQSIPGPGYSWSEY